MRNDTKARQFRREVKEAAALRDMVDGWPCCIWCGEPSPDLLSFSCAHFISRAQGGLGVEGNCLTLCPQCHRRYDQTADRRKMYGFFRRYLHEKYPGWNELNLYRRDEKC